MNLAVIGLGKLGLPLAALQAQTHRVYGIDSNRATVDSINRAVSPIREPGVDPLLKNVVGAGNLTAHQDFSPVADCDISLIIVPTPSLEDGSFSSEYVVKAVQGVAAELQGGTKRHVIVVCSTVMPGQCDTVIRDALEEGADESLGERLALIYSPEFIALGSVLADMTNPAVNLVGVESPWAFQVYRSILPPAPTVAMSWVSAEIAKISLNAYVTQKISFANTLGELCDHYPGADAFAITEAIGEDPRVGHRYLSPGGPYGGPCFPRDNRAYARVGKNVGMPMLVAQSVDMVNQRQIDRMVKKIKSYGRSFVGVLGLSYKPGAPIYEESFGMKLVESLCHTDLGIRVYDALIRKIEGLFPEKVDWFNEPMGCFGNDVVTVLTVPEPDLIARLPEAFETASRSRAVLLDPWDCVPHGPWHDSHIVTLGRGN